MRTPRFSFRALVSLTILTLFFTSVISGMIMYVKPDGSVASWVFWRLLGLSKTGWEDFHTASCFLLLVFGLFHILINWKSIKNYFFCKASKTLSHTREIAVAAALVLFVLLGTLLKIPPFPLIRDFGDSLTDSWLPEKDFEPPFGHAERLSLREFSTRMDIDLQKAVAELQEAGIDFEDDGQSLEEIALANGTIPMNIYILIKKHELNP